MQQTAVEKKNKFANKPMAKFLSFAVRCTKALSV